MQTGASRAVRQMAISGVVSLGAVLSPAHAATADGNVDPRLRYQLLSIAVEAASVCDWAEREVGSRVLERREALAAKMIARDVSDAGDLAVIRNHARRIFRAEGCQSPAIADLVATVRAAESE